LLKSWGLVIARCKIIHRSENISLSWADITGAIHYKLLENPGGISGFSQTGSDIAQGAQSIDHIVPLHARLNVQYILRTCAMHQAVSVAGTLVDSIGYFRASNTEVGGHFGKASQSGEQW